MRRDNAADPTLPADLRVTSFEPELPESRRNIEERPTATDRQIREKALDKTLADSFPTSDPPSTIPNPSSADSFGEEE